MPQSHLAFPLTPQSLAKIADVLIACPLDRPALPELMETLRERLRWLEMEDIALHAGSFTQDPAHPNRYYLAADLLSLDVAAGGEAVLLGFHAGDHPHPPPFPDFRAHLQADVEASPWTAYLIPFGPADTGNLAYAAAHLETAFGAGEAENAAGLCVEIRHPHPALPAVFRAFATLTERSQRPLCPRLVVNTAGPAAPAEALALRDGEDPTAAGFSRIPAETIALEGFWHAFRAGYRGGYSLQLEGATTQAEHAELRAHPESPRAYSDAVIAQRFAQHFSHAEQDWVLGQFEDPFVVEEQTYTLDAGAVRRLAVLYGPLLQQGQTGELRLDGFPWLTEAAHLLFCLHWRHAAGRTAQVAAVNLGLLPAGPFLEERGVETTPDALSALGARVKELSAIARAFGCLLRVRQGDGKQERVLRLLGWEAQGQLLLDVGAELELQLFDVLAEQAPTSEWRQLFERMVARAEGFAARGLCGEDGDVAARFRAAGKGMALGSTALQRADGNPFLHRWLGRVVGSRDIHAPSGDHRYFREKLDALPAVLAEETRRRNQQYLEWLAGCLWGV